MWHQRICELVAPHVSSGIRGLRCPQAAGKEGMGQAGVLARGRPTPPCRLRAWWAHHSQREAEDAARTDALYLQSLSRPTQSCAPTGPSSCGPTPEEHIPDPSFTPITKVASSGTPGLNSSSHNKRPWTLPKLSMPQFLICEMGRIVFSPPNRHGHQTTHKEFSTMPGTHVRNQQILLLLNPFYTKSLSPARENPNLLTPPMSDLKSSPVPRGGIVGGTLQMHKLNLIGGLGGLHTGRELHLQKFVGFMPVHLEWG